MESLEESQLPVWGPLHEKVQEAHCTALGDLKIYSLLARVAGYLVSPHSKAPHSLSFMDSGTFITSTPGRSGKMGKASL